jgi:hypothetical protein
MRQNRCSYVTAGTAVGFDGTHRVVSEAVADLKAQADAKFHMYYFVLC